MLRLPWIKTVMMPDPEGKKKGKKNPSHILMFSFACVYELKYLHKRKRDLSLCIIRIIAYPTP